MSEKVKGLKILLSFVSSLNTLHRQPTAITLKAVKHYLPTSSFHLNILLIFLNSIQWVRINWLIKLMAHCKKNQVPCILGVNLSDVDLMEFLQQVKVKTLGSHKWYVVRNIYIYFSFFCVATLEACFLSTFSWPIQVDLRWYHPLFSVSLIQRHAEVCTKIIL